MGNRARDTGLPVLDICAEKGCSAVFVGQFKNCTESGLAAYHADIVMRSDDLVAPPSGSGLHRQLVGSAFAGLEGIGNVVSKRTFGLCIMREARLQDLFSDELSVYVKLINSKACCHPLCRFDGFFVHGLRNEPTGTVGCTAIFVRFNLAFDHRGINSGYPLGRSPSRIVESGNSGAGFFNFLSATGDKCQCGNQQTDTFHLLIDLFLIQDGYLRRMNPPGYGILPCQVSRNG